MKATSLFGAALVAGLGLAEDVEMQTAALQRVALGAATMDRRHGGDALHLSNELAFAEELTAVADDESAVLSIEAEPGIPARIVFADDSAPMQIIKKHGEAKLWVEGGTLVAKGVDVADCRNTVAERDATIVEQQGAIKKAIAQIETQEATIGGHVATIAARDATVAAHEATINDHAAMIAYLKGFVRTCYCVHGDALEGPDCNPDQGHRCKACHEGYHLSEHNGECVLNTCACFHGFGTTGPQCATHGTPHCAACEADYTLVGTTCQFGTGGVKKVPN